MKKIFFQLLPIPCIISLSIAYLSRVFGWYACLRLAIFAFAFSIFATVNMEYYVARECVKRKFDVDRHILTMGVVIILTILFIDIVCIGRAYLLDLIVSYASFHITAVLYMKIWITKTFDE